MYTVRAYFTCPMDKKAARAIQNRVNFILRYIFVKAVPGLLENFDCWSFD